MTGPEHYVEAERILGQAPESDSEAAEMLARAQVHATLAAASATAMASHTADGMSEPDFRAWDKVCGVLPG